MPTKERKNAWIVNSRNFSAKTDRFVLNPGSHTSAHNDHDREYHVHQTMTRLTVSSTLLSLLLLIHVLSPSLCFVKAFSSHAKTTSTAAWRTSSALFMAQVSEKEARVGIDKVVKALQNDSSANKELGRLTKVTTILGYGSPSKGTLAVRFNAAFQKGGMGRSAVPLPFGLGQSEVKEGRGTMVGQVKASLDEKTGKVTSCSVFRDLGYGRAFNLKI